MTTVQNTADVLRPPAYGSVAPEKKRPAAAKFWFFTYNFTENGTDPVLEKMFLDIVMEKCEKYMIQEEIGEESKLYHLQGTLVLYTKGRPFEMWPPETFKVWWKKTGAKDGQDISYCSKSKTATGRRWARGFKIAKPLKILKPEQLFDWQKDICTMIQQEADDRSIYWYWSKEGNIGKSTFAKYVCATYGALMMSGKASDIKNGILGFNKTNGDWPEIIIYDLARCQDGKYVSYQGLEDVKNGCWFSGKYEGGMALYNAPHVLVFGNIPPELDKMSRDRWHVLQLDEDQVTPEPYYDYE